jgi:signal peptidase I
MVVVIACCTFRSAVADWNDVPTGSMRPTIIEGDRILVNKLAYDLKVPFTTWRLLEWSDPQAGEIVVCYSPADGTRLVKRVVAMPGDNVELRNNVLYINGKPSTYEPLDADTIAQVDAQSRPHHLFANETLNGRKHAVMATPSVPAMRNFGPVTVADGQYFVLGDNRDNSRDSRFFGFVPREEIIGRTSRVVMSLEHNGYYLPRWDRIFRPLR